MSEQFISEPIKPVADTLDTARMSIGEPGLPREFLWRNKTIEVKDVLRSWRETGPCRHGSRDVYLRKNWYEIKTADDTVMKIYFDRQPKGGRACGGWFLFSMDK